MSRLKKKRMIVDRNPVRSRSAKCVWKIFIQNERRVTHQINQHAQDCKVHVHRPESVKLSRADFVVFFPAERNGPRTLHFFAEGWGKHWIERFQKRKNISRCFLSCFWFPIWRCSNVLVSTWHDKYITRVCDCITIALNILCKIYLTNQFKKYIHTSSSFFPKFFVQNHYSSVPPENTLT